MKLVEIIRALDDAVVQGVPDAKVEGVSSDSRTVRRGWIFVALPGSALDGASFARDAAARGAAAVVWNAAPDPALNLCQVRVADPRRALARIAALLHGFPGGQLTVIGITGTNGKTTTAYLSRDILRSAGLNPGLTGTVQYEVGSRTIPAGRTTPDATLVQSLLGQMVNAGCKSAVMEVSSHGLVQHRVDCVDFDVGVFTNLTGDHLDYHGSMEEYFQAKRLLFAGLGRGRKAKTWGVVGCDDEWGRRLAAEKGFAAELVSYGLDGAHAVRAESLKLRANGMSFRAVTPWGSVDIESPMLGRHNVRNILAALAATGCVGVDLATAARVLAAGTAVPGRLELVGRRGGFSVYVDYAHTDDALRNVLSSLREITTGRIILMFGCGGNRDATKRPRMAAVASELADHTVLTLDNPRKEDPGVILAQIRAGLRAGCSYEEHLDRREAIRAALAAARAGDTVLLAGKGHEVCQEFANLTAPFDDRQVAREELGRYGSAI